MKTQKEEIVEALKKYLPEDFIPYVVEIMFSEKVNFKISKPRSTKLGDYRAPVGDKPHRITINGNLNPYSFLITTLHEFAHLKTQVKYGNKVKAHGKEWKDEFRQLLIPIIAEGKLPKEIETALLKSINNLKASSCSDISLTRALRKFDNEKESVIFLEEIENNAYFRLGQRVFQRGNLRRRRYICKEIKTGKQFLVNRLAEVEPVLIKEMYE